MKKPGSGKKSQSFPVPIGKELFRNSYSQIHAVFRMFQEFFTIPILSQISVNGLKSKLVMPIISFDK